jgi:CDP-glucose 4,6-dehydratase
MVEGRELLVRSPGATRPWQHVLDALHGYLLFMERLAIQPGLPPTLNFGPADGSPVRVEDIVAKLQSRLGVPLAWKPATDSRTAEKQYLQLDASLAQARLNWRPRLDIETALDWTCEWYAAWRHGEDVRRLTDRQIDRFSALA